MYLFYMYVHFQSHSRTVFKKRVASWVTCNKESK